MIPKPSLMFHCLTFPTDLESKNKISDIRGSAEDRRVVPDQPKARCHPAARKAGPQSQLLTIRHPKRAHPYRPIH